ncbi:MAG: PspA/IM30 family protein, partial [Sneathiella sp.]|nr:PspA/IM30 family protein [Sneathiella sp.]
AIADKKDIEKKLEELQASQIEWGNKAEFALSNGREDLAKGALVAKAKMEEQAVFLKKELGYIDESLDKTNEDLSKLQSKLDEAKAKKKSLEIRLEASEKRVKLRRTTYDGRVDDALSRYASLERKVNELDAESESYDLGRKKTLKEEFSEMEAEAGIEAELAALKSKMAKSKKN